MRPWCRRSSADFGSPKTIFHQIIGHWSHALKNLDAGVGARFRRMNRQLLAMNNRLQHRSPRSDSLDCPAQSGRETSRQLPKIPSVFAGRGPALDSQLRFAMRATRRQSVWGCQKALGFTEVGQTSSLSYRKITKQSRPFSLQLSLRSRLRQRRRVRRAWVRSRSDGPL